MASLTQIRRLLNLLDHLRAPQPYSARELAERLDVSRRTLFRDLRALSKLGFLVHYDERAGRYLVTTEEASAEGTEVPTDELKALLLLGQKLDSVDAGEDGRSGLSRTAVNLPKLIDLRYDGSTSPEGEQVYPRLLEGVVQGRRVRVAVDDAEKRSLVVAPLRFIFSHGRWHMACDDAALGRVRFLALDQIFDAELTDESFSVPESDELELAIEAAWQTDVEFGASHEIIVRFSPAVARDVAARRWFRTQELSWLDNGSLEFRTQSALLDRISSWVLSFGIDAEVVAPQPLVEQVQSKVRRLCDRELSCSTVS